MITAYVPRPSKRPVKQSEFLRYLLDSIMCDIEFCASPKEMVDVINENFNAYIKEAEDNGN